MKFLILLAFAIIAKCDAYYGSQGSHGNQRPQSSHGTQGGGAQGGRFQVAYQWHALNFNSLPSDAAYDKSHPVPFGIARHKNRMFIAAARRNSGVPVTVGYININDQSQDPLITPYPNYQMNSLHPQRAYDPLRFVSVYRPRVSEECNQLWFVDTGVLEIPNNRTVVQRPSVWVINLNDDSVLRRYEIPESIVSRDNGRGLVSLTVDNTDGTCHNNFAYITDWLNSRLIVYSYQQHRAWNIDHNYFSFDPLQGNFNVDGLQFSRRDGMFSVALSHLQKDGYKIAFFHAMVSDAEFVVSTKILRNETLATRSFHGNDFKLLGKRDSTKTQAGIHVFDPKTRVMLITQLQRNAVDCWRFDVAFNSNLVDEIEQHDEILYYPVDISIDSESTVWVLSNKMPRVIYSKLNFAENNFYILRANLRDLIRGKKCNVRDGITRDEMNLRVSTGDDDQ